VKRLSREGRFVFGVSDFGDLLYIFYSAAKMKSRMEKLENRLGVTGILFNSF